MKNTTLLDKVKAIGRKPKRTKVIPDADTALAWLRGDVALSDISEALGDRSNTIKAYVFLTRSLAHAYREGKITCQTKT